MKRLVNGYGKETRLRTAVVDGETHLTSSCSGNENDTSTKKKPL